MKILFKSLRTVRLDTFILSLSGNIKPGKYGQLFISFPLADDRFLQFIEVYEKEKQVLWKRSFSKGALLGGGGVARTALNIGDVELYNNG